MMKKIFVRQENTKTTTLGLYFRGGTVTEKSSEAGLSHFLEHMCFRRWDSLQNKDLYRKLNKMGVTMHGVTTPFMIGFYASCREKYAEEVFTLLLQLFNDFSWTEEEVQAEKRVVLRQIQEKPGTYYFNARDEEKYLYGTSFNKELSGTEELVERMDAALLNRKRREYFCSDNAVLIVTGNYSVQLEKKMNDRITVREGNRQDNCSKKAEFLYSAMAVPKNYGDRSEEDDLLIDCNYESADVLISFDLPMRGKASRPAPAIDLYAVEMLLDILMNGDGARVSWLLKDERGWTGDVWGEIASYYSFHRIKLEFTVDNENLAEALQLVMKETARLKNGVTQDDYEQVKEFYSQFPAWAENPQDYNQFLSRCIFEKNCGDYLPKDLVRRYNSITRKELSEAADSLFASENLCFSISYNSKVIKKKELKQLLKALREEVMTTGNNREKMKGKRDIFLGRDELK